ncbi:GNAT family N-acetyltransferase [uncultured Draconibacterium sp.]|uniref:GNAT family N-acetyltransferase n=1 Tax=uncultured Draconibacterium sp. TaxID=1573823 RepID=UPI002AA95439|nr:GNAT family N-acetyltransferase [uncultured Draconibacterium sp.]
MKHKKSETISRFVNEMYILLIGIGLGNMIFRNTKRFNFSEIDGFVDVFLGLFVIYVAIRYWLDWIEYIQEKVKTTKREFIIDFLILINILLLFSFFYKINTLTLLMLSISTFDLIWTLNYIFENRNEDNLKFVNQRNWIIEKLINIIIWGCTSVFILGLNIESYLLNAAIVISAYSLTRIIGFSTLRTNTNQLKIEQAVEEDFETIASIHNRNILKRNAIIETDGGFLLSPINVDNLIDRIKNNSSSFYVCKLRNQKPNKIIGFMEIVDQNSTYLDKLLQHTDWLDDEHLKLIKRNKHVHILTIASDIDYRGMGVGSSLYEFIEEEFPFGIYSAFIAIEPYRNKASISFHEKYGFMTAGSYTSKEFEGLKDYKSLFYIKKSIDFTDT